MRIRRNKKGFTLVELIVVIAILAVLAAVATVSVTAIVNNAKIKSIESDLNQYKSAHNAWVNGGSEGTFAAFVTGNNATYKIEADGVQSAMTSSVIIKRGGYTGTFTFSDGKIVVEKK